MDRHFKSTGARKTLLEMGREVTQWKQVEETAFPDSGKVMRRRITTIRGRHDKAEFQNLSLISSRRHSDKPRCTEEIAQSIVTRKDCSDHQPVFLIPAAMALMVLNMGFTHGFDVVSSAFSARSRRSSET